MRSSSYYNSSSLFNTSANEVWFIVSIILAVIGGIVLYFLFLSKKNEGKFTGFVDWMYKFFNFKTMLAEMLLKILYVSSFIFVTLFSFSIINKSFLAFLLWLVVGNVVVRLIYEFLLLLLVICRNTSEINQKLGNSTIKKNIEE